MNNKKDGAAAAVNIRKAAFQLLESYEGGNRYVNLLLSAERFSGLSQEESASLTALLYTAVEKKLTYDYFIAAFSKRSIEKISPRVRNILRIGLCQVLDMKSIPDYAAVNETVKLAHSTAERSFVNAVLREASRSKECLPYPPREKNELRYLSVRYSVPLPLVRLYTSILGNEGTERLLEAFCQEKRLTLTVNTARLDRVALVKKLSVLGAKESALTKTGVILEEKMPPQKIKGFSEGEFFVQDEASRLAFELLSVSEGDTVIDVCSAPGGKSFGAAMLARGGHVYSFDIHESKLSLIKSGAQRLGFENITVMQHDATAALDRLIGRADRVICDVPCSGLGIISKKPDIRYKDLGAIGELYELQYSILEASARYLKPGGLLAYSTCTVNPAENEAVTDRFVAEHPDFSYERISAPGIESKRGITLYPHIHGTDGFYIALIKRNK